MAASTGFEPVEVFTLDCLANSSYNQTQATRLFYELNNISPMLIIFHISWFKEPNSKSIFCSNFFNIHLCHSGWEFYYLSSFTFSKSFGCPFCDFRNSCHSFSFPTINFFPCCKASIKESICSSP